MKRALFLALCLAACGDDASSEPPPGDGGGGGGGGSQRFLPLAVGSSWTYRVTDAADGSVANKTTTVEALEDVGGGKEGVTAFRVRTEKANGKATLSWQEDTGSAIVRHREQALDAGGAVTSDELFEPGKLRLDESEAHVQLGAAWDESYTEEATDPATGQTTDTDKTDHWTVEAVDEELAVPAGVFRCLRLHRVGVATAGDKTYWFARGVGKIKELGEGQTEELASSSL